MHKYTAGSVLVLAGSRGMTGAAVLSARAALRAGAGLVTLGVPEKLADLIDAQTPEILTLPLPSRGGVIAPAALEILNLRKYDCVLAGPGLSARHPALNFAADLLQYVNNFCPAVKIVLDADALRALPGLQRRLRTQIILTPHTGELAKLLGVSSAAVRKKPYALALNAAAKYRAAVVLKNANRTYIVRRPGRYFLNCNGNPGMATAGSGDVLAGIIAGLWVSTPGLTALRAAAAGPYVHGLAGNLAAAERSIDGIIASDILHNIPKALKILKGE
jgi:NAD(P)H-hydrate epimerase